jgi:hypothetical protein
MPVKKEITKDTSGGIKTYVFTPDTEKVIFKNSMNSIFK